MASAGNNTTGSQQSLSLLASLNRWGEVKDVIKSYCRLEFSMNNSRRNHANKRKLRNFAGFIDGDYCEGLSLVHRVVSQANVPDREELLDMILSLGCDPDAPTKDGVGMRPSHLCIKYGFYKCLRSLYMCRIDLSAKVESTGDTLFALAWDLKGMGAFRILTETFSS